MNSIYKFSATLAISSCLIFPGTTKAGGMIAGYDIANEQTLRTIPTQYIDTARATLHIAYQHTSHGTHVTRGMLGLTTYKPGDNERFGIKFTSGGRSTDFSGTEGDGRLDFHDYAINVWPYNTDTPASSDLSYNETAFIQLTRNFLDAPENQEINVVMWSWCDILDHDVSGNYLSGMQTLIDEYGPGGTRILSGQRSVPVTFIFMTGHANYNDNIGPGKPRDQAELITEYCERNGYYCLDYYDIDTHDMEGRYWEDAGDDGNSPTGGEFYQAWQDSHTLGEEWFENRDPMSGEYVPGEHNTQHITANRKAYAMWWLLARIAGWDPDEDTSPRTPENQLTDDDPPSDTPAVNDIVLDEPFESGSPEEEAEGDLATEPAEIAISPDPPASIPTPPVLDSEESMMLEDPADPGLPEIPESTIFPDNDSTDNGDDTGDLVEPNSATEDIEPASPEEETEGDLATEPVEIIISPDPPASIPTPAIPDSEEPMVEDPADSGLPEIPESTIVSDDNSTDNGDLVEPGSATEETADAVDVDTETKAEITNQPLATGSRPTASTILKLTSHLHFLSTVGR